ncbi:FMN-linked oxidoreductase [Byssothecium circinans]|uniref:FMN-linked oxidoreductase n=1 Tax=Byssothecium circinans TaxID=147558 RepID=A0A6A5TT88_9PLEO|nr:FMN-linked oxidoreductase [Byssothecium circinans]
MDPKNPNRDTRNTPQYALYQRQNFWKSNDGEPTSHRHTHTVNRQAFYRHRIIPRMLVNTNQRDTATQLFGHRVPAPIGFAPIGINKIYHRLGELPVAKVAGELGLPYCLSTEGSQPIEEVGKINDELAGESGGVRFFQLYMPHDDELTRSLLTRAVKSRFTACILTLDTWQLGWRHDDVDTSNYAFYHGTGADLGLSDPVFQERLKAHGIDPKTQPNEARALWIDNVWHGRAHTWEKARWVMGLWEEIIDGAVASLDALEAVGDKTTIMFDSGVRSASDVFKALALGAKFVFVRRLWLWGLSIMGEAGVRHVMKSFLAEFDILLNVAGYKNVGEIDRTALESGPKDYPLLPVTSKL